ncbi:hypothetical protein OG554_03485 [Streptomyces griseus]|uniref:hypothetical protein n=1 Tax=Streptomyces griseus TaxID=1911 RepID=UPI00386336F1|nr:hypothetical protein OG554_03485 [Streptomyces fimicarius]
MSETSSLPAERVGTPADSLEVRLVRSRYADGQPPVIVIAGTTRTSDCTTSSTQLVIDDWKAAENLAYEILEEVRRWPDGEPSEG